MPDEKKRRRKPLGFNIGADIAKLRGKSGLSRLELSRVTGISRTVLIGYETGRTVPGAREIRLLCDALKATPNRLLYGREEPFRVEDNAMVQLGFTDDAAAAIPITVLFRMLARDERAAVLTLMHSILEARQGKEAFTKAQAALGVLANWVPEMMKKVGAGMERALTPEMLAEIEADVKRLFPAEQPAPPKLNKRPSKR